MPDFRIIPSIDVLRQRAGVRALEPRIWRRRDRQGAARRGRRLRARIAAGDDAADAAQTIEALARAALARQARGSLRPVINADRRRDSHQPWTRAAGRCRHRPHHPLARGYSNLEYDLETGGRGSRTVHAESLLTSLTGAEAAVVVNNNAAAILLILPGLASGREVVISRGELVEIGGGFRVPDVMRQSGATLREVGTTNRTRITDYTASVSPATAMFLRVHPSNFRIEGFTERPALGDLVAPRARCTCRSSKTSAADACRRSGRRTVGAGVDRRRRRPGVLQRRQAARRPAVRHHRRTTGWSIDCGRIR